jgi:hypothetical protein
VHCRARLYSPDSSSTVELVVVQADQFREEELANGPPVDLPTDHAAEAVAAASNWSVTRPIVI